MILQTQTNKSNIDTALIWTAPLAGVSDAPFRIINKRFGAKVVFSEMVSVEGLKRNDKKTKKLLLTLPEESALVVQLFGSNPDSFYEATKKIMDLSYIKEININAGCPVRKVIKNGSGCALMSDTDKLFNIVKKTVEAVESKIPVSVKIRSGWNFQNINAVDCALKCQEAGASLVIVHPRTASMMFTGLADWNIISDVKKALIIPVVGNGDITNLSDAKRMIEQTNCDAVMVGRALVGNPWLLKGESKKADDEFFKTIFDHIDLSVQYYGKDKAAKLVKKHLIYYAKDIKKDGFDRKQYSRDIQLSSTIEQEKEKICEHFKI